MSPDFYEDKIAQLETLVEELRGKLGAAKRRPPAVCPKCKGTRGIGMTTVGYGDPDRNCASCPCGWSGLAFQTVPAQQAAFLYALSDDARKPCGSCKRGPVVDGEGKAT